MLDTIEQETTMYLVKAKIRQNLVRKQVAKGEEQTENITTKSEPKRVTKVGRNDLCPCGSKKNIKIVVESRI